MRRVGEITGIEPNRIGARGRYADVVEARSLLCYWAVRELGVSATELARRFGMARPAVSISIKRGESLANAKALNLLDE